MEIIKIALVVIIAVIVIMFLKEGKPEFAIYVTLATSIIIVVMIFNQLGSISTQFINLYNKINIGKNYLSIVIKILAVAYISEFTIQLCCDSGEKALGTEVELAGKLIIFYIALPVFISIFNLIEQLI